MSEWTNEFTLHFLEVYKSEPILWDPMHIYHKDKKRINDVWLRLSEDLQISVAQLKKKKDSLMATFRGHLRKRKSSIRSGAGSSEIYKPIWFAYETMETFLGPTYEYKATINAENKSGTQAVRKENPENYSVNKEEETTGETPTTLPETHTPTAPQETFRRRRNSPQPHEPGKPMENAFNTLNNVVNQRTQEEDECDLYAKMLAKKLRKLSEYERDLFMYEIDGMFINRARRQNPPPSSYNSYFHASPMHFSNRSSPSRASFSEPSSGVTNIPNKSQSTHSPSSSYSPPAVRTPEELSLAHISKSTPKITILSDETIKEPRCIVNQNYCKTIERK